MFLSNVVFHEMMNFIGQKTMFLSASAQIQFDRCLDFSILIELLYIKQIEVAIGGRVVSKTKYNKLWCWHSNK